MSYTNIVKHRVLGVPADMLEEYGAVSAPVARAMAEGARKATTADCAVSVTGVAGPDRDERGKSRRHGIHRIFVAQGDDRRAATSARLPARKFAGSGG